MHIELSIAEQFKSEKFIKASNMYQFIQAEKKDLGLYNTSTYRSIKNFYIYFLGFFCWSLLMLMRVYEVIPDNKISHASILIVLLLHVFIGDIRFSDFLEIRKESKKPSFFGLFQ